jgi:hypothetical protein
MPVVLEALKGSYAASVVEGIQVGVSKKRLRTVAASPPAPESRDSHLQHCEELSTSWISTITHINAPNCGG